ncbi:MAG: arsenic efflux protein [Clostridia bacterium]|nr:arsenic efflux protein [Clostridia bacterium]
MSEIFTHSVLHAVTDTLKMLPILFLAYLLMEVLEHFESGRLSAFMNKSRKLGPLMASAIGLIPQCGFSGGVASLYAAGTVTTGTLISVILATSDEMLPVLLSANIPVKIIIAILLSKLVIGVIFGFATDFVLRKKKLEKKENIHEFCEREHCRCKDGVFISALKHTLKIAGIILLVIFLLNLLFELISEETLKGILNIPVVSELFASAIGLIPSCSVSVLLTNLFANGALGISPLLCGLLTNGGIGLLVLYRANPNKKDNLLITLVIFAIGFVAGTLTGLIFNNIL